jgi:hypothetical protein
MSRKDDYLAVLSSAVAEIEIDSFEARGVVYDRPWAIVAEQIQADYADPGPIIAQERAAFLSAIQAIEFGHQQPVAPPVNERIAAPPPVDERMFSPPPLGERAPARPPVSQRRAARPPMTSRRKSMRGRIVFRMVSACVVLVLIWFAYVFAVVRFDSAAAKRWTGDGTQNSWTARVVRAMLSIGDRIEEKRESTPAAGQRAVLYEESDATATGHTFSGRAVWRHETEPTSDGPPAAVLSIDVAIPQKNILLQISLKRAPDGGVISHFVEFKFQNPDGAFSDAVEDVLGLHMKTDELSRGVGLIGKVVKVRAGLFLMGLSGAGTDASQNLKLLKERPWIDLPIIMKDRSRNLLAIEKGTTGQAALDRALVSWGQS